MIGAVIPYFQRDPGLLRRAILSIADQATSAPLRIYVVDDGSPAPVAPELECLPTALRSRITVWRQPNAGPGAARNLAMDRMPQDVDIVAFLDSDDSWRPAHLGNILTAIGAGADFYFCDHRREDHAQNRFLECGYSPNGLPIAALGSGIRWCTPESVFEAVILKSPVGTSTVAIRRATVGTARFPRSFRSAGEDSIFWLEVLARSRRAACGLDCQVSYGRGVSIFNHGDWGDPRALRTTLDEMRLQRHLRRRFRLSADQRAQSLAQTQRLDLSFCANVIACARRLRLDAAAPALHYALLRPTALLRMPQALLNGARARLTAEHPA